MCGELDLSLGSPAGLGCCVLSSLTLMFALLELSPPSPALSPSLAARTRHSRKQSLLNSALIQASTSRVCSVLDIPPSRFVLFFAALLLSARHPVPLCPLPALTHSILQCCRGGGKCFCERSTTMNCKSLQHYRVILNVHGLICFSLESKFLCFTSPQK